VKPRLEVWAFLFFPLIFCAVDLSGRESYEELAGRGLYVNSEPSGAKVFINGIERGKTPFNLDALRAGEYSVRVAKEGYLERRFTVTIRRSERVEVTVVLQSAEGRLLIELERTADPSGGERPSDRAEQGIPFEPLVHVDGNRVDKTTLDVPVGWRTITVEAFGWEKQSQTVYVAEGSSQTLTFTLKPRSFVLQNASLRKKRFNPAASGALGRAEITFEVSAPGSGRLEVADARGRLVYSGDLGPFRSSLQSVFWQGRTDSGSAFADGEYTIRLYAWAVRSEGADPAAQAVHSQRFTVTVDSSLETRPLSISSLASGLLFAALPEALPAFSYQVSGEMLSGKPFGEESWKSFPLAVSARFAILDQLEVLAAFNAAPRFEDAKTLTGWGGSAKWIFRGRTAGGPFAAALSAGYAWAREGAYTPFFMPGGALLRLPLSLRVIRNPAVDLALSPGLLWVGEKGYPSEAAPRAEIAGGLLLRAGMVSGGVSARGDYGKDGAGPFAAAAEFKVFPSNFYASVNGGVWLLDGDRGAFFGVGLGVIY
jgi:hypothetical protein